MAVPLGPPHAPPSREMDLFHGREQPLAQFQEGGGVTKNFEDAKRRLFLSPQEQNMYQLHLHNLWSDDGYSHPDGGRSTYYMTPHEENGRVYALPGVAEGRLLDRSESVDRARQQGLDNFPSYGSHEELNQRYGDLHQAMEKDTNDWEQVRSGPLMAGDSQITEGYQQGGTVQRRYAMGGRVPTPEPEEEEEPYTARRGPYRPSEQTEPLLDRSPETLRPDFPTQERDWPQTDTYEEVPPQWEGREEPEPAPPEPPPERTDDKISQLMRDPEHGSWHDDGKYQIYTPHPSFFTRVDPRALVAHFDRHHPEDHKLNLE